jgi:hypothetical protein
VEPPAVLDRAAARRGLAVLLGQVAQLAVLQVALAERRVLQAPARLRVQRVRLLALSQQWAPQLQAQVSWE